MIFQDPYSSLNPRMTVRSIVEEPLDIHAHRHRGRSGTARVAELLELVGLSPRAAERFPARVQRWPATADRDRRALALNPDLIVADEPISALDVSIRAQILALLERLQAELASDLSRRGPRPRHRPPDQRPSCGDVPRPDRESWRRPRAVRQPRCTRTPSRCSRRCRSRTRRSRCIGGGSSSSARSRVPPTRRRAATSTRAAGCTSGWTSPRCAGRSVRRSQATATGHEVACHFVDRIEGSAEQRQAAGRVTATAEPGGDART